jgi:hypothetical protein
VSSMEINKGKLIPVGVDTEHFTCEEFETYEENGFIVIDGEIYEVQWEIKRDTDDDGLAYITQNNDGTIDFFTRHYNGGGCFQEVIEFELTRQEKLK